MSEINEKSFRYFCQHTIDNQYDDSDHAPTTGDIHGAKYGLLLLDKISALTAERDKLKAMVDGATPVIEIWEATTPSQKQWKENWLYQSSNIMENRK